MTTVGNLIQERRYLALRKHVWESVKEFLSRHVPRGDDQPEDSIKTEFGSVPPDIISDVLVEIDADCIGEIDEQIRNIDHLEVQRAERKKDRADARSRPAKKGRRA